MDLSKLNTRAASDVSKPMKLRNPFTGKLILDEEEKPIVIDVLGIGSQAAKTAMAEQQRRTKDDMTDAEKDELGAEMLACVVTGWTDNIHIGDEKLSFSKANAIRLFIKEDWIAKQILYFCTELRNYDPNA